MWTTAVNTSRVISPCQLLHARPVQTAAFNTLTTNAAIRVIRARVTFLAADVICIAYWGTIVIIAR